MVNAVLTVLTRRQFAHLVNRVWFTKERAALTRYGRVIVAVVPIEDLELLQKKKRRAPRTQKAKSPAGRAERAGHERGRRIAAKS